MEVTPKDILLRIGCTPHGVVVVGGARRAVGSLAPAYTHTRADASTCATYIDRDGIVRLAAANKLRVEYARDANGAILDALGNPLCGLRCDGSQQNLCDWSDALTNWSVSGTPTVTNDFATLGNLSLALVEDNDAGVAEHIVRAMTFTGDGVKGVCYATRAPATPSDGNLSRFRMRDTTAAANRLAVDHTWNSDGTLANATAATGTVLAIRRLGLAGGFPVYLICCQTTAVTAANTNRPEILPANETPSNVGKMVVGGVTVVNGTFVDSLIKTSGSLITRAADALTVPFNFGPMDLTVYAKMKRPVHADASGDTGIACHFYMIGTTNGNIRGAFSAALRSVEATIDTAGTDQFPGALISTASPTDPLTYCAQFRNFATGPSSRADLGAGFGSFSANASALTAFTSQIVLVGTNGPSGMYGVLIDFIVARGLFTRAEMLAAAA